MRNVHFGTLLTLWPRISHLFYRLAKQLISNLSHEFSKHDFKLLDKIFKNAFYDQILEIKKNGNCSDILYIMNFHPQWNLKVPILKCRSPFHVDIHEVTIPVMLKKWKTVSPFPLFHGVIYLGLQTHCYRFNLFLVRFPEKNRREYYRNETIVIT